jgi:ketosteroid isomerase-like protein
MWCKLWLPVRTCFADSKMKLRLCLVFLLSTEAPMASIAQDPKSDENVIRALDDQERQAALTRDIPALERLWSAEFVVNAPTDTVVVGREAVLDTFIYQGVINFSSFDRAIEYLQINGDWAIIMGAETVMPVGDAPLSGQIVRRRFTNIWKKEAATWRLFARHANNVLKTR